MLTNDFPHDGTTFYELQKNVQNLEPNLDKVRSAGCSQQVIDLLQGLLEKDASKRLTVCEILQDPWVTRNNTEAVDLDLSQTSDSKFDQSSFKNSSMSDDLSEKEILPVENRKLFLGQTNSSQKLSKFRISNQIEQVEAIKPVQIKRLTRQASASSPLSITK